jgi:hypothetical protein
MAGYSEEEMTAIRLLLLFLPRLLLKTFIRLIKEAVAFDQKADWKNAIKAYKKSVELLRDIIRGIFDFSKIRSLFFLLKKYLISNLRLISLQDTHISPSNSSEFKSSTMHVLSAER